MNIQQKNSAHHFRMQSEREQTLVYRHGGYYSVRSCSIRQLKGQSLCYKERIKKTDATKDSP